MGSFMLILFITIVAFGDSLLKISLANNYIDGGEPFIGSFVESIEYTYLLTLGDFSLDNFGNVSVWLVWTLFILCTVFNLIVMLNLLIAIISETFGAVTSNADMAAYKVQASLIAENNYLVPDIMKETYAKRLSYLIIVSDTNNETDVKSDKLEENISELKNIIQQQKKQIQKYIKEQNHKMYVDIKKCIENTNKRDEKKPEEAPK